MIFPQDLRPPDEGYQTFIDQATFVSDGYDSGTEFTRKIKLWPTFRANLKYQQTHLMADPDGGPAMLEKLYLFFRKMDGRNGTFTFVDYTGLESDYGSAPLVPGDLLACIGDGVTTTFDLPLKSMAGPLLNIGAVLAEPIGAMWNGTLASGTDTRDQATFTDPPGDGLIVTVAQGTRAFWTVYAGFDADIMSFTHFAAYVIDGPGLTIVERRKGSTGELA